jgi:hypothetical protein
MKTHVLITSIAALLLATGTTHAEEGWSVGTIGALGQ